MPEQFSMETILNTTKADEGSTWSEVWSTTQIPDMDRAFGKSAELGKGGRRRLRVGALALACCLCLQCRVAAFTLTGGYLIFILFLIVAVTMIANPLRHFEVYLGQWSSSGPGRAFRIIPVVDGIGLAICINAILRAIYCSIIAAIAGIYISHSVRDAALPFTYCRDFQLNSYNPLNYTIRNVSHNRYHDVMARTISESVNMKVDWIGSDVKKSKICRESYKGMYPPLQRTPAYNYFYVEVMRLRTLAIDFGSINIPLAINLAGVWTVMYVFMIVEKILHKRLIFNNILNWFIVVPWLCALTFLVITFAEIIQRNAFPSSIRVGTKEFYYGFTNSLEVAVYIHSASFGTEIIHGKGLQYYASGHIDPLLYDENIWHSVILVVLTAMNATVTAACAVICSWNPEVDDSLAIQESTLWIIPMFSKCLSLTPYSHMASTIVFGGLMFSYTVVSYTMLKTALHTIFEYRVKLVFQEQLLVAGMIVSGLLLSLFFATGSGILLLEGMDTLVSGVGIPFVCLLELVGILHIYRSRDFESDMDVATEENKCGYRIGMQWKLLPVIMAIFLIIKLIAAFQNHMPAPIMLLSSLPLLAIILVVPLRTLRSYIRFSCKDKTKR